MEVRKSGHWMYYDMHDVENNTLHLALSGNDKTGHGVICFNVSAWHTCKHDCECFKNGTCYACGGCYQFPDNMKKYAENAAFIYSHTPQEIADAIAAQIPANAKLFRWHTIGDFIPSSFEAAIILARQFPNIRFWAYTKKYHIVNAYCDRYGKEAIPGNLTILFSEWRNADGTFYPMDNRFNFPVSRFIPLGCEEEAASVTHICPCSDPTVLTTCKECEHACYTLKEGESMALLEHSTKRTKERDRKVKAAHKELKKARKRGKRA